MRAQWRTKFGNVKVKIDGHKFDSIKEGGRYRDLLLLAAAREIAALELQPRYELQAAFCDNQGRHHRAITYTADFRYWECMSFGVLGRLIVEDVKSAPTRKKADYVIRKKLFIKQHPEITFKET